MSKTILTVDDSVSIRQMVRFTLESAGYAVVEAEDGCNALERISPEIKLIITDVNMPRMDGLTLVKQIRASATNKFTPILLLTTESNEAKKQEAKTAGATGWITKPFRPDQLLAVVKKVLG